MHTKKLSFHCAHHKNAIPGRACLVFWSWIVAILPTTMLMEILMKMRSIPELFSTGCSLDLMMSQNSVLLLLLLMMQSSVQSVLFIVLAKSKCIIIIWFVNMYCYLPAYYHPTALIHTNLMKETPLYSGKSHPYMRWGHPSKAIPNGGEVPLILITIQPFFTCIRTFYGKRMVCAWALAWALALAL